MNDPAKCPRCGSELPVNFPPGVCPTCLLEQGLSPSTFISGAGSNSGGSNGRRRSWTPPTPAELAPRFPQLEIVELLGQGGMGAVYKVRQRDLDRWAALKVLPDDVAHDPNFAERFQREARALALLGHQHIVIVYEFGQRDGVYFLLMEYIDGVTLRQAIRAGQVSAKDALSIVAQICDALQFAHEEGVVHRDIKPENILLDKRGRVKIADFGLAKLLGRAADVPTLTGTHQVMGTPLYMAPEQLEGTRSVDHRADIFSLGVVFYELLTGELPLGRFAPPSQKYQLDVRLDDVVLRSLEKEPDRRYQQASQVKSDVDTIRNEPVIAATSTVKRPRLRWRWVTIAASVTILLGGIVTCGVLLIAAGLANQLEQTRNRLMREQQQRMGYQIQYESLIKEQRAGQKTPASVAPISQDPNEADAIVQFTDDGPRLNPEFEPNLVSAEQRKIVNRILTSIDKTYVTAEHNHTTWKEVRNSLHADPVAPVVEGIPNVGHPSQISLIEPFEGMTSHLENELWTAIDSQLPVDKQKLLRRVLPLFADATKPLPLVTTLGIDVDGILPGMPNPGMAGGMPGMPGGMGMSMMGGSMGQLAAPTGPGGGMSPGHQNLSINLRYRQLLGWKMDNQPMRISIGRQGRWYRWAIETVHGKTGSGTILYGIADSGEAPELPTGLRRFWRADASQQPVISLPETEETVTPDSNSKNVE